MSDKRAAEESGLHAAAIAISRGSPVDWNGVVPADAEDNAVLAELRVLEQLSRINDPVPAGWGPFVITHEIGRGSFGTVYAAVDPNLQMELALKVIRPRQGREVDPDRALAEARLLARIDHPHVVRIYRAERLGDDVGVAMELVSGSTLAEVVQRQGPFSAREAMLIGTDLCQALASVHALDVVHGDIKAHNVMRADGGRIVLMDFGSARHLAPDALRRHVLTGTPLYLAPELFAGEPRSKASDIYSLGVLLYYITSGAYPVEGTTRSDVARHHAQQAPRRPLRDVRPDLPEAFIRIVERTLSDAPGDRYQSAGALEADLAAALAVVETRRAPDRFWTPGRMTGAAATVLLVAGLSGMAFYRARVAPPPVAATSAAPPAAAVPATAAPADSPAAGTYRIQAALYREENGRRVRLESGARVAPGDALSLELEATVPLYVYVVNEDDQGESYLLFPLPGHPTTNPLPAGQRHRLPGVQDGESVSWQVTSAGGREHFLIVASPDPPTPAFTRLFANMAPPAAGRAVSFQRLSREAVGALRGVGGLAKSRPDPGAGATSTLAATPLSAGEEATRGVWVRQVTLENR